jgi:hypothetical protein
MARPDLQVQATRLALLSLLALRVSLGALLAMAIVLVTVLSDTLTPNFSCARF